MRSDADDFAGGPETAGPLFDSDPFERSAIAPDQLEICIAGLIWSHRGRENPVPIAEICRRFGQTERQVKSVVEELRRTHRVPIGARRTEPVGYFRIIDAEDLEIAMRPYREQVIAMWRTLRALDSRERLAELLGQLRLEE